MSNWIPTKGGPESNRRRSQRVILSLAVTVRTEATRGDASFEEETQTLVVNAHGALVAIAGKVEKGQMLRLKSRATGEEKMCQVMYIGAISGGKAQIGVEFTTPDPDFWHITFPPEGWSVPEPVPATGKDK